MSTDRHRFLINLTLHKELVSAALGFSPNQRFMLFKSRKWHHLLPGTEPLHAWSTRASWILEHDRYLATLASVVQKMRSGDAIGLSLDHHNLTLSEVTRESKCYVLCHTHLVNAVRHLSKCCASFLTEPTMYGAWSIPCHVDIGGSKWDV